MKSPCRLALSLVVLLGAGGVVPAFAAEEDPPLPEYLKDRGTGVALSMFGSYARRGELIVYPYWEYYPTATASTTRRSSASSARRTSAAGIARANGSSSSPMGSRTASRSRRKWPADGPPWRSRRRTAP